jgi:hypothetical protein
MKNDTFDRAFYFLTSIQILLIVLKLTNLIGWLWVWVFFPVISIVFLVVALVVLLILIEEIQRVSATK